MSLPTSFTGTFYNQNNGLTYTGTLGTLTAICYVNRNTASQSVPVVDSGGGVFTVDLSGVAGAYQLQVTVTSDLGFLQPYVYSNAIKDPFPWDNGASPLDAAKGARCARTGTWTPASLLKYVQGIPFRKDVAPDMVNEPVPNLPGILTPSSYTDNTPNT